MLFECLTELIKESCGKIKIYVGFHIDSIKKILSSTSVFNTDNSKKHLLCTEEWSNQLTF